LADPDDDFVLELAVAGGCRYIVTHNLRDFRGSERWGVEAIAPGALIKHLEALL
ncbi:PIN domain-containing protein, partial [Lamprobacter modestohalophilus]|uniref:PIN domain-containing protein n=1 Tax=Lamprobacter modestohalophilus TaxID=1064514 RepID=UPI003D18EB41